MATGSTIDSLRRSVHRISDAELKAEILDKVTEVQHDLATAHDRADAQRGKLDHLRGQVGAAGQGAARSVGYLYDPPI